MPDVMLLVVTRLRAAAIPGGNGASENSLSGASVKVGQSFGRRVKLPKSP